MMGKQNGQIQIAILDIDSMIPEDHLLRQIKDHVNFDFISLLKLYRTLHPEDTTATEDSLTDVTITNGLIICITT